MNTNNIINMDYKIKAGDTLSKIGKRNNISVDELVKANKIANPNVIVVGKTLVIPGTKTSSKPKVDTPTKSYTPEADNTGVQNPIVGKKFTVPTPAVAEKVTSIPYNKPSGT